MLRFIYFSCKQMTRRRVRTLLTVISVAVSICSIVIINIISDNGKTAIGNELSQLGIDSVSISADGQALSEEDLKSIQSLPGIKNAVPLVVEYTAVTVQSEEQKVLLWGVNGSAGPMISIESRFGRMLDRSDVRSCAEVCVIDSHLAKALYGRENVTGKTLRLLVGDSQEEYTIVGVAATGGGLLQNFIGDAVPGFVYLPYTTLLSATGKSGFYQAVAGLEEGADADTTCTRITRQLEAQNRGAASYTVDNYARQKKQLDNLLQIITLLLSAIAAISLLVAGLGIMTTMMSSVNERMKEIGIKKSIGASRIAIAGEFLAEAAVMCLIGSLIGAGVGVLAALTGQAVFGMKLVIDPLPILFCVFLSVLTGGIFGAYPAIKAACLRPVDILKNE